jgi:hypothetical protein
MPNYVRLDSHQWDDDSDETYLLEDSNDSTIEVVSHNGIRAVVSTSTMCQCGHTLLFHQWGGRCVDHFDSDGACPCTFPYLSDEYFFDKSEPINWTKFEGDWDL